MLTSKTLLEILCGRQPTISDTQNLRFVLSLDIKETSKCHGDLQGGQVLTTMLPMEFPWSFPPQRLSHTKLSVYEKLVEFQRDVFLVSLSYAFVSSNFVLLSCHHRHITRDHCRPLISLTETRDSRDFSFL